GGDVWRRRVAAPARSGRGAGGRRPDLGPGDDPLRPGGGPPAHGGCEGGPELDRAGEVRPDRDGRQDRGGARLLRRPPSFAALHPLPGGIEPLPFGGDRRQVLVAAGEVVEPAGSEGGARA